MPTIYVLSKNKKNIKLFLMKFSIFKSEKNLCILHGHVSVLMILIPTRSLTRFFDSILIPTRSLTRFLDSLSSHEKVLYTLKMAILIEMMMKSVMYLHTQQQVHLRRLIQRYNPIGQLVKVKRRNLKNTTIYILLHTLAYISSYNLKFAYKIMCFLSSGYQHGRAHNWK